MEKYSISQWLYYELKYYIRININKLKKRIIPSGYMGRKLMLVEETNRVIYDKILEGKPFWAGRMGGTEMNMIAHFVRSYLFPFRTNARKDVLHDLYVLSGFFPEEIEKGEQFVELMLKCVKDIDLIGVWSRYMEEWLLARYVPKVALSGISYLEPWKVAEVIKESHGAIPWTWALEGKKVLVIHPFVDSIKRQYMNNRTKIFKNLPIDNMLPEFELITIKAVQTLGDNFAGFEDWFEALDYMVNECKQIDFDVAIIGCGAYGFPLAAEVKRMGKIAIHLGGATQVLFGIRGARWDGWGGGYAEMINECWIRPSEEETIKDCGKIEGGCYW